MEQKKRKKKESSLVTSVRYLRNYNCALNRGNRMSFIVAFLVMKKIICNSEKPFC